MTSQQGQLIRPTLPGQPYELRAKNTVGLEPRLFMGRTELSAYCKTLLPRDPVIAEVGVYGGHYSEYLASVFKPELFYLIDLFEADDRFNKEFTAKTHFSVVQHKFSTDKNVRLLRGLSWDMLASLPDDSVDYIYIDADHRYSAVKKDALAALPKLRREGILQFNDYCTHNPYDNVEIGVLYVVNELLESGQYDILGMSLDRSGFHDIALRRKL